MKLFYTFVRLCIKVIYVIFFMYCYYFKNKYKKRIKTYRQFVFFNPPKNL